MDNREIAARLKLAREEARMTQQQVAKKAKVATSTVMRYEKGEFETIKEPVVAAIARAVGVMTDWALGVSDQKYPMRLDVGRPIENRSAVRIIGTVRAGYGGLAYEDFDGYEGADVKHPEDYIYFRVEGDSMAPAINNGDLALVRIQEDVEPGQIAVVVVNGEEGTIKKVIKGAGSIALQPFNPAYETRIFTGAEANEVRIAGLVVETKRKWA